MRKTVCALFLLFAVASANGLEFLDDDNTVFNEDIEFLSVNATAECMSSVAKIIPALNTFIKDVTSRPLFQLIRDEVRFKKELQIIIDDYQAIFGEINSICDSCNLQKPTILKLMSRYPSIPQACAGDAQNMARFAADIIKNANNPSKIVDSLSKFVKRVPHVFLDCGIRI